MRKNMGLFRGKNAYTEEWVHGYYVRLYDVSDVSGESHRIYPGRAESDCGDLYPDWYEAEPATVGECTGLRDKNGKLIFEGDIISIDGAKGDELVYVKYQINGFECVSPIWKYYRHRLEDNPEKYEIIGNIHDNPELLPGAKKGAER